MPASPNALREKETGYFPRQLNNRAYAGRPSGAAPLLDESQVASICAEDVERWKLARGGGMFAGLMEWVEAIADTASLGEPGVRWLSAIALDENWPLDDRKFAIELLAFLPSPTAFETIMRLQGSDLMKSITSDHSGGDANNDGWSYDVVVYHLSRLRTQDLGPYISIIQAHALADLREDGGLSDGAMKVAVQLAFRHGDPTSASLLERLPDAHLMEVARSAKIFRTQAAYQFLQGLSNHPSEQVRKIAQQDIAHW